MELYSHSGVIIKELCCRTMSAADDITQRLKVVPSYIITSYLAGDYFQASVLVHDVTTEELSFK